MYSNVKYELSIIVHKITFVNMMEVEDGTTVVAKEPEAIDGDEEIDELSASFALIEASLQDQVY